MKKVSKSQAIKNREVQRIKKTKPNTCIFCGFPCGYSDGVHLMNKNIFGQYYTEPQNIWKGHRECHTKYDDDKAFRSQQEHIIKIVEEFATKEEIYRYFKF